MGGIDCILDLSSGVCENVRVGVGCGSRSESGVTEGVARAPEQLDTGPIHVTSGVLDHHFEVPSGLRKICTRRSDIDVVEAEGRAELGEELESSIHLQTRRRHWIAAGLEGFSCPGIRLRLGPRGYRRLYGPTRELRRSYGSRTVSITLMLAIASEMGTGAAVSSRMAWANRCAWIVY